MASEKQNFEKKESNLFIYFAEKKKTINILQQREKNALDKAMVSEYD
jgi:hypothetical protein